MTGFNLLADYGIDDTDIPESVGRKSIEDGVYPFTVIDFRIQEGTTNNPDTEWIIIDYDLGEDGQFREWFTTAEDGDRFTDKVKNSLSFLRKRLVYFGQSLSDIRFEDGIGATGTLELVTKGKFQNITEFSVDGEDSDVPEEPAEAPVVPKRTPVQRVPKAAGGSESPFGGKRRS